MKTQIAKQITRLTLTVLASVSIAGVAQGSECATAPDAVSDTQDFADKMVAQLKTIAPKEIAKISKKTVNDDTVMDHKFHKLDRSQAELKKLDAVGIVTAKPFDGKLQSYGSAVLISPCHVLTNRHVVEALSEDNNQKLAAGNQVYFSAGQAKACDSGKTFEEQSLNSKVVAFGADDSVGQDWAIVKLDRPIGSGIQPIAVSATPLISHEHALRVGFPYSEVKDKAGFKNSRIQYIRAEAAGFHGVTYISDKASHPGLSGGSIIAVGTSTTESFKPKLTGIVTGGNQTISFKHILSSLNDSNPAVVQDIQNSFKAGHCN